MSQGFVYLLLFIAAGAAGFLAGGWYSRRSSRRLSAELARLREEVEKLPAVEMRAAVDASPIMTTLEVLRYRLAANTTIVNRRLAAIEAKLGIRSETVTDIKSKRGSKHLR